MAKKERVAIADIHGEWEKLIDVLIAIEYSPTRHQLIFLGDYIDRGPNSAGVLRKVRQLKEQDGAIALRGNHERFMINVAKRGRYEDHMYWELNGGLKTYYSYSADGARDEDAMQALRFYAEWLLTLPMYYEDDDYFFSHAPLPKIVPNMEVAKVCEDTLTWTHFQPEHEAYNFGNKIGICGHVHALRQRIAEPRFYPHYYYLDGGCGCHPTGQLWAVNLDAGTYTSHKGEVKEIANAIIHQ